MYPNKPTNYLKKWLRARRVAAVAIVALLFSVLINIGMAKNLREADSCADQYRDRAWTAYDMVDSLQHEVDAMMGEKWFVENMCNE